MMTWDMLFKIIVMLGVGITSAFAILGWRRTRQMDFQEQGTWKGKVNTKVEEFEKLIEKIQRDIADIRDRIMDFFQSAANRTIETKSLSKLTELGEKVAKEIDSEKWAAQIYINLLDKITNKSSLEIEFICIQYVVTEYDFPKDLKDTIDFSAYANKISKYEVEQVLALAIRNKLIKEGQTI